MEKLLNLRLNNFVYYFIYRRDIEGQNWYAASHKILIRKYELFSMYYINFEIALILNYVTYHKFIGISPYTSTILR